MTKRKRHGAKMYEKFYGKEYVAKTIVEIRECKKCGRELPEKSVANRCPYCNGPLRTRYVSKQKSGAS